MSHSYLQIVSTGACYPKKVMTNDDWAETLDTSDEWIRTRTGIVSRRIAGDGERTTDMAIEAGRLALERSHISPEKIGCCLVATMTADSQVPNTACLVQAALHLQEGIPAMDINAACSGFVYALAVAQGLMTITDTEYALVIGSEEMTSTLDMTDRNTCILFGDGAGAVVVRRTGYAIAQLPGAYPGLVLGSRGDEAITKNNRPMDVLHMDGHAVYRFAVETLPRCIREVLEQTDLTLETVDHVVCHQANSRIIATCVRRLGADEGKFYQNLDHFGNTCAASIPLALNEMEEQSRLKRGEKLILVGFGGGLTWGGILVEYAGTGMVR